MRSFITFLLAVAAAVGSSAALAKVDDHQACDPVGCYPNTSFSVIGDYGNIIRMTGHIYYNNVKTDFKWRCGQVFSGASSDLPYIFEIKEGASFNNWFCNTDYDDVFVKYGSNFGRVKDLPNCSNTRKHLYRCIFKADGSEGSGQ
ncbi:Hypothetical protein R9X50_00347900 [Acrodontium crateriforme]|uniref:Uncharacterized protein n=1 Tax=Acrodontium crateriforme TaxID=150365 RepID=A0AAQ3M303_9PEZI|nr:Hypothetical protein R9X50_00347900 [Acrodontium crateriforme]